MKSLCSALMLITLCLPVSAQSARGTIKGRVVTDDGQPIPNASVHISGMNSSRRTVVRQSTITTDEEGFFQADGLEPAPYMISARAVGYAVVTNADQGESPNPFQFIIAYIGESVTITMIKGGVITGKVVNANGDPVVATYVSAVRVRDELGRKLPEAGNNFGSYRMTDDRGVYRLYGLSPGAYIVSAGRSMGGSTRVNPYEGRMPVYYPSSARDAASEVVVRAQDEVGGVDIRYRIEPGFSVSGKLTGSLANQQGSRVISGLPVSLKQVSNGAIVSTAFAYYEGAGFAFYGIPNGEYEIEANRQDISDDHSYSAQKRVTVNGRDLSGIELSLTATAFIKGTVVIEKTPVVAESGKCEGPRQSHLQEIVIVSRKDEASEIDDSMLTSRYMLSRSYPDEKGEFTIRNLQTARYRIHTELPDGNWYVKSIKSGAAAASDPVRDGIVVKKGDRVTGVNITVSAGAAGLKGKVVAAEGESLPARLRVFLVPAEIEAKDDLLRYREVASEDGKFDFKRLAPGKYFLLAKPIADSEPANLPAKPLSWDLNERAKLRKDAEAANNAVELKTCSAASDFQLRYAK